MKGLLVKDIKLAWEQKALLGIMIVCALVCLFTMKDPTFIIGYMSLICSTLGSTTCAYDEMNNGMAFIMTLPFSREKYIVEKYLFSVLAGLAGWCISTVAALIFMVVLRKPVNGEFMSAVLLFLVPIFLVPGLMIPIIMKFGHARSRIVFFVIMGVIFAIGGITSMLGSFDITIAAFDQGLETFTFGIEKSIPYNLIVSVSLIVSFLVYLVSLFLGIMIIKKKEY